jgi:DNA-binding response OmpR family regulator
LKTLFMSGYPDDFVGRQGVLEPGVAYLQKPFSAAELSRKVRQVLETPEQASILVIDDDEQVRSLLAQALVRSGYQVMLAADGKEGCRAADENPVDLVITDLVMPEREGLETVQYLRKKHAEIPVLAISGAFGGDFLKVAQRLGADEALQKPIDAQTLLQAVRRLLSAATVQG